VFEVMIELYNSKRSAIPREHALFHIVNPWGPLPSHIREENWPKECPRSWMKQAIEDK